MLELWRKHMVITGLSLHHEDPSVFVRSQWQKKPTPNAYYIAYRIVITLYVFTAWLLSIIDEQHLGEPYPFHLKWLIYLTNWGFTFVTLQAFLATVMLCSSYATHRRGGLGGEQQDTQTLRWYKFYWFCFTIGIDLGIAITILYWVVIYNPDTMRMDYLNIMVHCTNSAVMLMELCVVSHPVRLWHFYVAVSSGVAYTIFSVVYHLAGGTSRINEPYIYPVVDWRKPVPTLLVCAGACVFLMIIHCVTYLVFRVRARLAASLVRSEDNVSIPVQETFRGFDNDCLHSDIV